MYIYIYICTYNISIHSFYQCICDVLNVTYRIYIGCVL